MPASSKGPRKVCSYKFKVTSVSVVACQPFLLVWIHVGRKPRVEIKQVVSFPGKHNKLRGLMVYTNEYNNGYAVKLPKKGRKASRQ